MRGDNQLSCGGRLVKQQVLRIVAVIGIVIVYIAAAKFGLLWAIPGTNATPLWPPAGIAAAALIIFGWRAAPGVFIGALFVNAHHFIEQTNTGYWVGIFGATAVASGNLLEALIFRYLAEGCFGPEHPLSKVNCIIKFMPMTAVACLSAATVGTATMFMMGLETQTHIGQVFVTWWLGDALAILIITPLIVSFWPLPKFNKNHNWFEVIVAFVVLLAVCALVFGRRFDDNAITSRSSLIIPALLWFAFRLSIRELVAGVGLVSMIAVFATANGMGPFASGSLTDSFLAEQLFCAMVAITMLVLSSAMAQTRNYQRALKEANDDLEERVAARTKELEKKTRILETINAQLVIEAQGRKAAENKLHDFETKKG